MGSYDMVFFTCPRCETRTEAQSKSAKCEFEEYEATDAPMNIVGGLPGRVKCENCGLLLWRKPKYRRRINLLGM